MLITIHRGAEQVGGNCIELRSGNTKIMVDAGLPLDYELLTDKSTLWEDAACWMKAVDAIFITHAHADHFGLLTQLDSEIPIFMSKETKILIENNLFNRVNLEKHRVIVIPIRQKIRFKDFEITAYHVDHSAFGACAFLFEAEGKSILYSGDIRLHGPKGKLYKLLPRNPDYLILEGTNAENEIDCLKESELTTSFIDEFKISPCTLHTVWCSSQNIDRIVPLYKACKRTGKQLIVDPYTAIVLNAVSKLNSNIPNPTTFNDVKIFFPRKLTTLLRRLCSDDFIKQMNPLKNKVSYKEITANPSGYVMIVKNSVCDFLENLSTYQFPMKFTISIWNGYRDDVKNSNIRKFVENHYQITDEIHTSGHANLQGLRVLKNYLSPKKLIPVHTFVEDTYKEKIGIDNDVLVLKNGERMVL